MPGDLAQEGKGLDPEVDEPGPKVVVEGGRIFEPEDEDVARDHDDVEEEHRLRRHRQLVEEAEPTEESRHGAEQVPAEVETNVRDT